MIFSIEKAADLNRLVPGGQLPTFVLAEAVFLVVCDPSMNELRVA